jgi:hypothetical protein
MARDTIERSPTRATLAYGHLSDLVLANAVFMADRRDLDLTSYQTAAKERIRWLSAQLAIANQAMIAAMGVLNDPRISTHDHDCPEMIEKREAAAALLLRIIGGK